jgi:hypothetical protein
MDHDARLRSPLVAHDPIDEQSLIVLSVLHFLCPPEQVSGDLQCRAKVDSEITF